MTTCPCCSNILLRHLNSQKVTWFCLHCRQEMPSLILDKSNSQLRDLSLEIVGSR
jgi:hypothetical protein